MTIFLVRRLFFAFFTLIVITMFVYGLIRNMPGSPLAVDMAESDPRRQMSAEDILLAKKAYGLDKPWPIAYRDWVWDLCHFDLGTSFRYRKPVSGLILQNLGPTLLLSVPSFLLTIGAAIPIGMFVTRKSGRWDERLLSVIFYMLYSIPTYVLGLWLLYIFYQRLAGTMFQLPPGMRSDQYDDLSLFGKVGDLARHLLLPLIAYSYHALAYDTRFIKANMEEAIRQDYIRTARAKGLDDQTILYQHAFRNTLIPFVTMLGLTLPSLIGGAIIIERIFNWPGIGSLYINALFVYDYTLIMGLTLMFSVATVAGQLLADVLYAFVDPRVTHS